MNERAPHEFFGTPAHDGAGIPIQQPTAGSMAPWPSLSGQQFQPPLEYRQQQHQQPSMQQFQYAGNDVVLPGAGANHQAPMSAHDGMIGMPLQHGHPDAMPQLNGGAHGRHTHLPAQQHAQQPQVMQQPQAWAFPTPQGMQLVHPGGAHSQQHVTASAMPIEAVPTATAQALAAPVGVKRRMRWETIVPGAAVLLFMAAVALFISDFDRITGRDTAATPVRAAAAVGDAAATDGVDDTGAVLEEATALFDAGQFDDASNLLHPLLELELPDPKVVALHDRVDAAAQRNRSLLTSVANQRRAGKWKDVVTTIGTLEQLRPLTPSLERLRAVASRNARIDSALTRAKALMARGRSAEAKVVLDKALAAGSNRRLEALRKQLSTRAAASSTTPRVAATARSTPRAGGSARPAKPPAAGGRPAAAATVRPPANVSTGAIPARPDAPNPANAAGSGAAAVAGGGGADCHAHDGVTDCH